MAFYVRMNKVRETDGVVRYRYSADEQRFGEAELDKASGEVRIVRPVGGVMSQYIGVRAAAKLRSEWKHGRAPDIAEWAS